MQVKMCFAYFIPIGFAVWLSLAWSCFAVTAAPGNFGKERLQARITRVWSDFSKGDFKAFASMWSEENRRDFRESDEDWQKTLRIWKSILREKPTFELLDLEITGQRARAKMRVSNLEEDGSRSYDVVYDYWVFENGDWFLDDASRTQ
jgi:hypothetical protein